MSLKSNLVIAVVGVFAQAHAIDFNYEQEPLGARANSYSVTQSGVTLTANNRGGWLHITDHDVPTVMGSKYIIATSSADNNPPHSPFSPIEFVFSQTVTAATLLAGDTGGDNDGFVTLNLYDSLNNHVASLSTFLGTSALGVSITTNTPFTRAIVDTTDTTFNPHSIGAEWINVNTNPVPEPLTMSFGGLGLFLLRRRKS